MNNLITRKLYTQYAIIYTIISSAITILLHTRNKNERKREEGEEEERNKKKN